MANYERRTSEQSKSRITDTAAAYACRRYGTMSIVLREEKPVYDEDDLTRKWGGFCESAIPTGKRMSISRDELAHYFYAQALCDPEPDRNVWHSYSTATFDRLQETQLQNGRWPSCDGISVGPVYATAMWCLVLQMPAICHRRAH